MVLAALVSILLSLDFAARQVETPGLRYTITSHVTSIVLGASQTRARQASPLRRLRHKND
jgi:hypothetical protein